MTATTRSDFTTQHSRDLALIESLREQLAAANGRAARAEHKVRELTETCASLRARLPRGATMTTDGFDWGRDEALPEVWVDTPHDAESYDNTTAPAYRMIHPDEERALRAERDALARQVERVEALCDEADAKAHNWFVWTADIRAALSGAETGSGE